MPNILNDFTTILVEQLAISRGDIAESSNLAADLGADSLDLVEIEMAVEEEWDIIFPDGKRDTLETVADWVEFIGEEAA